MRSRIPAAPEHKTLQVNHSKPTSEAENRANTIFEAFCLNHTLATVDSNCDVY